MCTASIESPAGGNAWVPLPYRVAAVHRELHDTVTLTLEPDGGTRPAYRPGQFNMLYAFGVGEVAISISGQTGEGAAFLHTVRDVGAVSRALAGLKTGGHVGLRGPFGSGWPVLQAEGADVVFVAGGLGLAPLRPAIQAVLNHRDRYGRVVVLFGCRNPAEMLYRTNLELWRQRLDVDIEITVDHADPAWHGNVGVVPDLIQRMAFDPDETLAMVCGPEVMMRFTVNALRDAGVADERIHLSMERNMKCAIGLCGHCQYGPAFICRDGPVMRLDAIAGLFSLREI